MKHDMKKEFLDYLKDLAKGQRPKNPYYRHVRNRFLLYNAYRLVKRF